MTMYTAHDNIVTSGGVDYKGRGWSPSLWTDCPWRQIEENPQFGQTFFTDFNSLYATSWAVVQATSGTIAATAGAYGLATIDAGASTNDQGVRAANPGSTGSSWIVPSAGTKIWFECLAKFTNVSNGFFAGIATHGAALSAAAACDATDYAGFYVNNDGNLLFTYKDAGDSAYSVDTTKDLTSGNWIRLGFKIEGTAKIASWINGTMNSTMGWQVAAANGYDIPNAQMNIGFGCVANGATQPTLVLDWVRCAVFQEPETIVSLA